MSVDVSLPKTVSCTPSWDLWDGIMVNSENREGKITEGLIALSAKILIKNIQETKPMQQEITEIESGF